jgi:predicted dehydrogenase
VSKSPDAPGRARPLKGAVIGLGGIARNAHIPALTGSASKGRFELVAAVDALPTTKPLDGIPLFRSPDDLKQVPGLDFVDICTPTASHLELTLWALQQGYHVICEKPVAVTEAEADQIAAAAERAGRVVVPCHQYRYNPAWLKLKSWIDSGAIGPWHLAEFHVYRMMADPGVSQDGTPWRAAKAGRGGVLLDHGTHLIYELLDVAGQPDSLRAWTARLGHRQYEVEDTAQLIFEYPDRVATMFLTWAARKRETSIRFIGAKGSAEWQGGTLTLEQDGAVESLDYSAQLDKAQYAGWFAGLFGAFADAVAAGHGRRHLDDIRQVATVLEAAYASVERGSA